MRIGVDACCWSNRRGFGRFTRELLNAIIAVDKKNDYFFFVDEETASSCKFPSETNLVKASTSAAPTQAASASGRRSLRDLWIFSRLVMKHDLDIFFFPAVYSYFPIINRSKIILTVHDMIADNYPGLVFPNERLKLFWKLKQNLAVWQSHLILTVSEYSKQQVVEYFKVRESNVRVISEAASPEFTVIQQNEQMIETLCRHKIYPGDRFILYVGGISPHKNLKSLVDVYHKLKMDSIHGDLKLVLVGDYKSDSFYSDYSSLKSHVERLRLENEVIFTGFIEDRELTYLYNSALLLVLPSFEEGFGLPAVEAMACGTPVVSSDRGSLPEILGGAGRFFDPHSPETMLLAIREVLSDEEIRKEMRRRGLDRAKQFTWDRAASKAVSLFADLAEDRL